MSAVIPRRVSFYTLGCRLNQAETALMAEGFRRDGYEVAEHGMAVDVAVINTCSVTERADARCRNEIRKIRKRSPEAFVCAVGCYAQAEPHDVAAIPGVDLIVGTDRKYRVADMVRDSVRGACEGPRIEISPRPDNGAFDHAGAGHYPHTTRANVKIQDGCDFCCAFCILPRVRGRARSRRLGDIVAEGRELARRGHRELVVTGVNVGTYAFEDFTIVDVARELSAIPSVARVRISSIEPTTVPDGLLEWMAGDEKACRHLHLPLQSADDRVLDRMRRVYTAADLAGFIQRAKDLMPDLAIGTDVIVGFPGETDEMFENTVRFVEETAFSYAHVFSYSDRPKTVAAGLEAKLHSKVIKARSERMRGVASEKKERFLREQVGRVESVLFETVDSDGLRKGLTGSYVRVGVDSALAAENDHVTVRLGEPIDGGHTLSGTIVAGTDAALAAGGAR